MLSRLIPETILERGNQTALSHFILRGFYLNPKHQILVFAVMLIIYMLCLTGNTAIIIVTWTDSRLYTPMYFFLSNLAFVDMGFISTTVPKLLINIDTEDNSISFTGCFIQMYFYLSLGSIEFLLLSVMSVDRYVAICHALHYDIIMHRRRCIHLSLGCWAWGFLSIVPIAIVPQLPFCGHNIINHFFCDSTAVIQLSCDTPKWLELLFFSVSSIELLSSFLVTLGSYAYIIAAIVQIPSSTGRSKVISTCASHFIVVAIAYGSCILIYLRPAKSLELDLTKKVALLNSVMNPFLHPFIYTLRNEKVKEVLGEAILKNILKCWKQ